MTRMHDFYLAVGAAVALWWTISMQVSIRSFVQEVTTFKKIVYQTHTYMKEFLDAYENATDLEVDKDIRTYFSYSPTERKLIGELSQDDEQLVEYIRHNLLIAPPIYSGHAYGFDRSRGILPAVMHYFKNLSGGFYVECCAFDGAYSQAHFIETNYRWQGLVIEEEPSKFAALIQLARNVWILPTCVSLEKKPVETPLILSPIHVGADMRDNGTLLQCMPLYSVLKALERTQVDFFSFYNSGRELEVLQTIPFNRVNIKSMVIYRGRESNQSKALLDLMTKNGYYEQEMTPEDYLFFKPQKNNQF